MPALEIRDGGRALTLALALTLTLTYPNLP